MTHNYFEKGVPSGQWARAARRNDTGVFGVQIGCGEETIGFIPETALEAWIAAATKVAEDELAGLVADATAALPKFKAECARHEARTAVARNN